MISSSGLNGSAWLNDCKASLYVSGMVKPWICLWGMGMKGFSSYLRNLMTEDSIGLRRMVRIVLVG